ncbi:MAG: histidinol-phosphatase [Magnetococcales bacterium]|nr:histidinol-phosphatase [Magnetococcales bacterium]
MIINPATDPVWRNINLHTHTWRCHHAQGDVDAYCQKARERNLHLLGFSDHTPLPDGRWASIRMDMSHLEAYDLAIETARHQYAPLHILKGMECEFVPEFVNFYRETLLDERKFDYLVGGVHLFDCDGQWLYTSGGVQDAKTLRVYTDFFIAAMDSGLFRFMAHPDLFAGSWLHWDAQTQSCMRALLDAARSLEIPLEINANGLRQWPIQDGACRRQPYPWLPFWEMAAEFQIQVVVNADAHHPDEIHDGAVQRAFLMAESLLDQHSAFSWLEFFHASHGRSAVRRDGAENGRIPFQ